jgi:hypothetical protein
MTFTSTSTSQEYQKQFDILLGTNPIHLNQSDKETLLLPLFNYLHQHHQKNCQSYRNIMQANKQSLACHSLIDLPYLAVRLFKHLSLSSIELEDVFKTLQSSGTTGQTPAQIVLDKATSARQSKALVNILQPSIGKQRLPMLIIDSPAVLKNKPQLSARGAGIQGLAFFGRYHTYALDEDMQPNWSVIMAFAEKYANQPVLIFGFTFMVWVHFIKKLQETNQRVDFVQGILLHSGGWKKLEAQKVDNQYFKQAVKTQLGITKVHNFYGMAEQVGSVFVECTYGHLHAPVLADVIMRDPFTLEPSINGEQGIVQVLSVLPTSYPGFSLLTEDLGRILGVDDCPCGQKGKYFTIDGRLPKTEVRGCSDTHAGTAQSGTLDV